MGARPVIAAIVLAAGSSRRFGAANKLLAEIDGVPLLARVVARVLAARDGIALRASGRAGGGTHLPPPLWGRAGGGGNPERKRSAILPPPAPPHQGEGGTPKPATVLEEPGIAEVVVVTGHEREAVAAALAGLPVRLVHNPRYAEGIGTSIATGIGALGPEVEAAFVCLGDMPETDPALIRRMIAIYAAAATIGASPIVVPTTGAEQRQGNPVLWPRRHFAALASLGGDQGARALIAADGARVVRFPSDGTAAAIDLDTPEALAAYLKAR